MKCIARIKSAYYSFSKLEKKVADYMLANPEAVTEMSVADLSGATGAAKSTIIKMCKDLGYTGYVQFKIDLSRSAASIPVYGVVPGIEANDDDATVINKVFASGISTLTQTLAMLDAEQVARALELMKKAKSINFFGVGTSAPVCEDAYIRFMRIGVPCSCDVRCHVMRVHANCLAPEDVGVFVSHSGRAIETVETLKIAKARGASTICLTSYSNTVLTRLADVPIIVSGDESKTKFEAISARLAHLTVLDALCMALALSDTERTNRCMEEMAQIYIPLRYKK